MDLSITIPYSYALKLGEVTVVACKKTREKDEKIENIDNENKRLLEKMGDIGDRKIKTKITSQPKRFSTRPRLKSESFRAQSAKNARKLKKKSNKVLCDRVLPVMIGEATKRYFLSS